MTRNQYALEEGAPKRLTLKVPFMGGVQVEFDGKLVDGFALSETKKLGREVQLPDGSVITIRSTFAITGRAFEIDRNGRPVPGSAEDPKLRVRHAAVALYVLAAMNVGFAGFIGVVQYRSGLELQPEMLAMMFAIAVLFAGCGFFASRGSLIAVGLGTVLYVYLTIDTMVASVETNGKPGNIILRLIFVYLLVRGVQGAWALRKGRGAAAEAAAVHLPPDAGDGAHAGR